MKKKISILLPDLSGGGVERIRISLAYEFKRMGYDIDFVLMKAQGNLLNEVYENFKVTNLGLSRLRKVPFALASYLKLKRPNILIAAIWPMTVIAPLSILLSSINCKVIISEHNNLSMQYKNWGLMNMILMRISMTIFYRLANLRIAVSQGVLSDISKLSFLSRRKFRLIPNPIRSMIKPTKKKLEQVEKLWSCPKGARILTVGSFKKQKNHELLLHAFSKIKKSDARLMFVGTGENYESLHSLAIKLGIINKVIFAGFHKDPSPFYITADLFVLSSDYEGFGNVIVEALSYSLPVVSTDCPFGPREILDNGKYGVLVPINNIEELTKGINFQLNTRVNRDYLRARVEKYSIQSAAMRYLQTND